MIGPAVGEGYELALVSRAAEGDRKAFGQLFDQYVSKVFRHISRLVDHPRVAEELTAQTFSVASRSLRSYEKGGASFFVWLLRITYRLTEASTSSLQHDRPRQSNEETSEEGKADVSLLEAVSRLQGDQRHVMVMRFTDGLSETEMAEVIAKSVTDVREIQYRALLTLRGVTEG